jgi:hypothetical protein
VTTRRSEDLDVPAPREEDIVQRTRRRAPRKRSGAPVVAKSGEAKDIARRVVNDSLESARLAYERAGRGCIVSLRSEDPRYATVTELGARLDAEADSTMLLTAISEAVERYDPEREAVVVIESEKGFEVSILSASGSESVGGLFYNPDEE